MANIDMIARGLAQQANNGVATNTTQLAEIANQLDGNLGLSNVSAELLNSIGSAVPANNSVTLDKLYFATKDERIQNLFNVATYVAGKRPNSSGVLSDTSLYHCSDYIPIEASTQYRSSDSSTGFVFYDESQAHISQTTGSTATSPENAAYIIIYFPQASLATIMFVKGASVPVEFLPYEVDNSRYKVSQDSNIDLDFDESYAKLQRGKNLFNPATATQGYAISSSTGRTATNVNYYASDFIEVEPETAYITSNASTCAQYDKNKIFISSGEYHNGITTAANTKFIRVSVPLANLNNFQLEQNSTRTAIVGYEKIIDANNLPSSLNSIWRDKFLSTLGDSLTNHKNWQRTVLERCGFKDFATYGAVGLRTARTAEDDPEYVAISDSVESVFLTSDFVTVMGGTNDFSSSIPLGDFAEEMAKETADKLTFYGALRHIIEWLSTNIPTARAMFITPPPRWNAYTANGIGLTLENYADAIIEVCAYYSIPVYDLFRRSGINKINYATYSDEGSSWLHFNTEGYKKIGEQIAAEINRVGK